MTAESQLNQYERERIMSTLTNYLYDSHTVIADYPMTISGCLYVSGLVVNSIASKWEPNFRRRCQDYALVSDALHNVGSVSCYILFSLRCTILIVIRIYEVVSVSAG